MLEEKKVSQLREKDADQKVTENLRARFHQRAVSLVGPKEEDATGTQQILMEQKDQLNASTHRLKSLEDLAAHHAYTSEAVRLLLAQAQEEAATHFQTPGILADFVEVESPYEAVVEAFLKQELEYILVESDERVNEGIQLLKEKSAGRSTFLVYGDGSTPQADSRLEEQATAALQATRPSFLYEQSSGFPILSKMLFERACFILRRHSSLPAMLKPAN